MHRSENGTENGAIVNCQRGRVARQRGFFNRVLRMIRVAGTTGGSPAARRLGKLIQTSVGAVLTSSSVAGVRLPSAVCQTNRSRRPVERHR